MLQGAKGGTVMCLASGDYNYSNGNGIDLYGVGPSSTVTLEPAPGATVELGTLDYNGVSNITVTGFTGSSVSAGVQMVPAGDGNNTHDSVTYDAMPNNGVFVQNAPANSNTLIAHDTFDGYASSGESSRLNIEATSPDCPDGVTVENNQISGGESDGIDTSGESCGTQILHNDISNIVESNCNGIHCDAYQDNGGGEQNVFEGNYMHNVSDCGLFDDGTTGLTYSDNVCTGLSDSLYAIQFGGGVDMTMTHNTFATTEPIEYGNDHNGNPSSNFTFTGNATMDGVPSLNPGQPAPGLTEDYNLLSGGSGAGAHDISGSPTFSGGSSPSSFAGFALASGSLGYGMDAGTSMGVDDMSVTPGP